MHFPICIRNYEAGSIEISPSDTLFIAGLAAVALAIYGIYNNYRNGMPLP